MVWVGVEKRIAVHLTYLIEEIKVNPHSKERVFKSDGEGHLSFVEAKLTTF